MVSQFICFLISEVEKYKSVLGGSRSSCPMWSSSPSAPLTSPSSTVHVKGQSYNLAHLQRHKEVLLLVLPASVLPRDLVLATAERMERVLNLLFGSPQRWVCHIPPEVGVSHTHGRLECGHC